MDPSTGQGEKTVETRSYQVPKGFRGRIAIHASKTFNTDDKLLCHEFYFAAAFNRHKIALPVVPEEYGFGGPNPSNGDNGDFPLGAVIGTVDLYDCRKMDSWFRIGSWRLSEKERAFGCYETGRFAWFLRNPIRFSKPIPARGALGLWEWMPPAGLKVS